MTLRVVDDAAVAWRFLHTADKKHNRPSPLARRREPAPSSALRRAHLALDGVVGAEGRVGGVDEEELPGHRVAGTTLGDRRRR